MITENIIKVKQLGIPKIMSFLNSCFQNNKGNALLLGGRRSGKTYNICLWIIELALMDKFTNAILCAKYYPNLVTGIIRDMNTIINKYNLEPLIKYNASSHTFIVNETIEIRCMAFADDWSKAKGASCDIAFFNEVDRFTADQYYGMAPNVRKMFIFDYNPERIDGWWNNLIDEDKSNFLKTTWQDNPFLTDNQKQYFHDIKSRGENAKPGSYDFVLYQKAYLGNFSARGGTVFQYETCTLDEYKALAVAEFAGLDFGAVKDPNALVGCKVFEGKIYLHEYIYKTAMSTYELYQKLCTLPKFQSIVYDYAGLAQTLVQDIVNYGYKNVPIHQATKTRVEEGVVNLASLPLILVDTDENLNREFSSYVWDTEKLEYSGDDHLIDATRYITHKLTLHKVIQY